MADGRLDISSTDEKARLIARDLSDRVVATGIANIALTEPGVYQVQSLVAGRQSEKMVAVPRDEEWKERIEAPSPRSVVPSPTNPCSEYLWQNPEFGLVWASLDPERRGMGKLIVCEWSPRDGGGKAISPAASVRPYGDWREESDGRVDGVGRQSAGFAARTYTLRPGTYEVTFPVSGLGKRSQAILLERGWTTIVFARVDRDGAADFGTSVVVMSQGEANWGLWHHTEIVLDALYFGHADLYSGGEHGFEPIAALAEGYGQLQPYRQVLLTDDHGGDQREIGHGEFENAQRIGWQVAEHLPHCLDARILLLASLWLKYRSSERSSKFASVLSVRLPIENRTQRLIGKAVIAVALLGAIAALLQATGPPPATTGSGDLLVLLLPIAAGIAWVFWPQARAWFSDDELPMFSEGLDILLALTARYERIAGPNSKLVATALRMTRDVLWTRWNPSTSSLDAHHTFKDAMRELESVLEKAAGTRPGEKATRSDADRGLRRLAVSVLLPLGLVRRAIGKAPIHVLAYAARVSTEDLRTLYRGIWNRMAGARRRGSLLRSAVGVVAGATALFVLAVLLGPKSPNPGLRMVPGNTDDQIMSALSEAMVSPAPSLAKSTFVGQVEDTFNDKPIVGAEDSAQYDRLRHWSAAIALYSRDKDLILPEASSGKEVASKVLDATTLPSLGKKLEPESIEINPNLLTGTKLDKLPNPDKVPIAHDPKPLKDGRVLAIFADGKTRPVKPKELKMMQEASKEAIASVKSPAGQQ